MEFIPELMVTGGFMIPTELQTGGRVGHEKFVSLYTEIRDAGYPYQSFQLEADEAGATMQAQPPGEVVTIKPPLVQIQSPLREGTVETAGRKAQDIMELAAKVLGVGEVLTLGIRVIYNVPLASNDARDFLLNRVLSFGGEHVDELRLGDDLWGGIKYVVTGPARQFTFQVEPAVADQMKSLYLEIDAQFPGSHAPGEVLALAGEVRDYVHNRVGSYLDKLAGN